MAKLAGVSPKTVSNVVNGQVPVSPHTRDRVEQAMDQLDYVPNLSARGLRNGRTGVIALALPALATSYSASMTSEIVAAAAERGWNVQIEDTGVTDGRREAMLLNRARAHLVDGLILNPVLLETSAVQRGVSLPPVVLIGEVDQPIADHVWIDNVAAADAATSRLVGAGHRRIAFLGRMRSATARLRQKGYRAALRRAGIRPDPELAVPCRIWNPDGGYTAMRTWLADHEPPDAIFASTDSLALGALHALADLGLTVPGDVSLVGYDDVPEAAHYTPPLTTVGFDRRLFAETVLTLLAERIADPARPIVSRTIPFRLVERESVRDR
ncbi:LacI family DNA-binding transcriptional regulator [Microlunatus kandeliicorticis]|uniref:LacI family DNA-binding transcriptional regulator n=1 Tax=Microlunatus kandeliicorticis TaxID=1759536 RepID=UPI002E2DD27D|nr:LacI family DNA-binding transcriptional regulator [Microlunatus kandeliicorticis]